MIGVILTLGGEFIQVNVNENNVTFMSSNQMMEAPIEGLKLSRVGTLREFPELEGSPNWEAEAIQKFKSKIKRYKTERQKINYVIEDLTKHGYKATAIVRKGHRPERL